MSHKAVLILGAVLSLALAAHAADEELVLVQDGEPMCVVVVPGNASNVVWEAASEFRDTIEKISGARITILAEDEFPLHDTSNVKLSIPNLGLVFIGRCERSRKAGIDADELAPEGFRIKVTGNRLYIVGRDDEADVRIYDRPTMRAWARETRQRGTLHGVHSFLEEELGVRWLFPGDAGEVIPERKDISVAEMDRTDAPRLAMRMSGTGPHSRTLYVEMAKYLGMPEALRYRRLFEDGLWASRSRSGLSMYSHITHGHIYVWLRHGKEHPEYMALQPDGKRFVYTGEGPGVRLCLSNDEVADKAAAIIMEWFERSPDLQVVGLCPDDGSDAEECVCDKCKAMGPTISDRYAIFYSKVAEIVSQKYPGRYVANFAYSGYSDAPKVVSALHPNVLISLVGYHYWATLWAGGTDDAIRERSMSHSLAWTKLASTVIWRPNLFARSAFGIPSLYSHKLAEDYRALYATGKLVGVYHDHFNAHWGAEGIDYYVAMKLAWNPEADVDAIIDDYCQKGFGPAAKSVRAYFDAVEKHTDDIAARRYSLRADQAKDNPLIRVNGMPQLLGELYPPEVLGGWQALLAQARADARGDEKVLARIALLQDALDLAPHTIAVHDLDCASVLNLRKTTKEEHRSVLEGMQSFVMSHVDSWGVCVPTVAGISGLRRLDEKLDGWWPQIAD